MLKLGASVETAAISTSYMMKSDGSKMTNKPIRTLGVS